MKPQATRDKIEKILKSKKVDLNKTPVVLVGIRGYYLDSMGVKGKNDRGVYDDAFFWITKNSFVAFNGNTDPSRFKKGRGKGKGKGMASLKTGVWSYKTGMHNGSVVHPAFRQAADVVVIRDGIDGDYEDEGQFGINIHMGGKNGTSSLGCQTVPRNQWDSFKSFGYDQIKLFELKSFPYVLIDETEVRKMA
jgi:lysozyme